MSTVKQSLKEHGKRFDELKERIHGYEDVKDTISTGMDREKENEEMKTKLLEHFNASQKDWDSFSWQMNNRISDPWLVGKLLNLTKEQVNSIVAVAKKYRFAVSPYYFSLIDKNDIDNCPIFKQAIPSKEELSDGGKLDPMDEEGTSVGELITRRYPDRLIIKVTNVCGMFCRFCQRRRSIGEKDHHALKVQIKESIEYVKANKEIRDVLITGGDSFMLSDQEIDWMLSELRAIEHLEIIRFGTRTPVTLPQRITDDLINVLKKYHPIFVNTHFNSVREITKDSKDACEKLANAGIPLGNQMVLLNGVNNNPYVVRKLNQSLLKQRVRPYYIFHPKDVKGTRHFYCKIEEGLEIMESLRGRTSGLAIPTYIVNGPMGLGKTPLLPQYLQYIGKEKAVLRNWEGKRFEIKN